MDGQQIAHAMGKGDVNWSSRSGVVLNPNPTSLSAFVQQTENSNIANGIPQLAHSGFNPQLLLSPQQFMTQTTGQHTDGDLSMLQSAGLNNLLTNLDISSSQFNKVINFDSGRRENGMISDTVEDGDYCNDSELLEQSLASESSGDLMQQRQAIEQAKMVAHFKQLRDIQQQQQLELMHQQQQRINAMREEQEKVQRMLNNARKTQWGGDAPSAPTSALTLPPHPPSPRKASKKHDIIHGPKQTTPKKGNRPVPNLPSAPSTPSEFRVNGNPDLESETASVYEDNIMAQLENDFVPLGGDSGSDTDSVHGIKRGIAPQEDSFVIRTGNLDFGDQETVSQPDLASLHELTSSAWKNNARAANTVLHSNGQQNGAMQTVSNQNPQNGQMVLNSQPPPGYINLLHLPNMLQGLPPPMLEQLLHLQKQGHSVVIDANGHLGVHDMTQGCVLPAGGMLNGLGLPQPQTASQSTTCGQGNVGSQNPANELLLTHNIGNTQSMGHGQHSNVIQGSRFLPNSELNVRHPHQRTHSNQGQRTSEMSGQSDFQSHLQHNGHLEYPVANTMHSHQQHLHAQNHNAQVVKNSLLQTTNKEPRADKIYKQPPHNANVALDVRGSDTRHFSDGNSNLRPNKSNFKVTLAVTEDDASFDESDEAECTVGNDEDDVTNEQHDDDEETAEKTGTFDELPVGGLGVKKTFEELLEEELRKDQERGATSAEEQSNAATRKLFLKKGEGMSRFGVGGKPPPPPKPKKVVPSRTKSSAPRDVKSHRSTESNAEVKQAVPRKTLSAVNKLRPGEKLQLKHGKRKIRQPLVTTNKKPPSTKAAEVPKVERSSRINTNTEESYQPQSSNMNGSKYGSDGQSDSGSHVSSESDCLGETSFQHCLKKIAHNEKVEEGELHEFEILEQYADDNASFLSNVSAVNRVLQQKGTRGKSPQLQRRTQPKPVPEVESEADDVTLADDIDTDDETDDNLDKTLQEQTENYTENERSKQPHVSDNSGRESRKGFGASHERETKRLGNLDVSLSSSVGNTSLIATLQSLKTMQRKVATLDDRTTKQFHNDDLDEEKVNHYDENHDQELEHGFGAQANNNMKEPVKMKRTSLGNEENWALQNNVEYSTRDLSSEPNKYVSEADSDTDFGDEDAWDEDSRADDDWDKVFLKAKSRDCTKRTKTSSETRSKEVSEDAGASTPPTSKLVAKLFPKLKPQKPKLTPNQEDKLEQPQKTEVGDGVQAKLLRDKLSELEREIERFRQENATLEQLRKEREEGLTHLKKEMGEFEKQKSDELKRIQDFKAEEMKKLKKEKKVFEEYQKNMKDKPNKKERDEIEDLKQQIEDLQDEMKRKEQRWTSSTTRLRNRVEILEQENGELKEEIKLLEKRRLEAWQQRDMNGATASSMPQTNKPTRNSSGSTDHTSSTHSHSEEKNHLKQSLSGPQLSTRVKQPKPHKHSRRSLQRDHSLRLSQNDLRLSVQSLDSYTDATESESIRPEDSASNIASHASKDLTMGFPEPRQSGSLAASQESSMDKELNSAPMGAPGSMGKKTSRKKATTMSVSNAVEKGDGQFEEIQHADGKVERVYNNGAREILFSNGTRKQVSADGQSIIVSFFNGDIKQILPDQRVVYYYSEAQTTHTTYPDGLEILQFPNNQVEKHYPDGTKEITFPDQTIKYLFPNGIEENLFPNGTVIRVEKNGDKTMQFANGQREVHTAQYKRREYPDGTVKTVYPDGRQETRYSSGRIRVKDKDGNVVMDKRCV